MTQNTEEQSQLGLAKLREEVANLHVEQGKKAIEIERAALEVAKLKRDGRLGWRLLAFLSGLTPTAAFVLAVASIGTLLLNWWTTSERHEFDEFRRIIEEMASESSAVRAGAVVQLGTLATVESGRGAEARSILLSAVGNESDFGVRQAVQSALLFVGKPVLPSVAQHRTELERELRTAFGRGRRRTCTSFDAALPRLRALQEGLITLAIVEARLTNRPLDLRDAPFRCASLIGFDAQGAQLTGAVLWQADLSGAVLVNSDLSDVQLDEADLFEADITGARFCGPEITGLDVRLVQMAKGWQTAIYPAAFAAELEKATRERVRVCQ